MKFAKLPSLSNFVEKQHDNRNLVGSAQRLLEGACVMAKQAYWRGNKTYRDPKPQLMTTCPETFCECHR